MKNSPSTILTLLLITMVGTPGCNQTVAPDREARLICFAINSHDLLSKVSEIASHIASTSVLPGDRVMIIDASRTVLLDETVQEPELLEPISDVRRLYQRKVDEGISKIGSIVVPPPSNQSSMGYLLLHLQRELSELSVSDKTIVMISRDFASYHSVDREDLAIYGADEVVEDLSHRGLVPNLQGFRIYRSGPVSSDINLTRIYDQFWNALLLKAQAKEAKFIGWESITTEIIQNI